MTCPAPNLNQRAMNSSVVGRLPHGRQAWSVTFSRFPRQFVFRLSSSMLSVLDSDTWYFMRRVRPTYKNGFLVIWVVGIVVHVSAKEDYPAMARRSRIAFPILLLFGYCGWARAQVVPAQSDRCYAGGTAKVTLGPSVAPLYGPWKFTVGDSPIDQATHAPLWAQPAFDDSQWETVDLTPKGIDDPLGGFSDYVKGWTARGHAGYSGYAWYRIRGAGGGPARRKVGSGWLIGCG